jgi:hypothetical protein
MAAITVSAVVAAVGVGLAGGTWTAAAIAFGTSIALSLASRALTPKQKIGGGSSYGDGNFTQQFRQSTPPARLVYGEVRVSGALSYIGSTEDNKFLHMVILLAGHEIQEIGEIIINDKSIPIDYINVNGEVVSGFFANKVRVKRYLGTDTQTADADLLSEVDEWTENHRLQGIAYLYIRLESDRNIFTSGIPNISAYIKGKKIYDPRNESTYYNSNIALITGDYLTDKTDGFKVEQSDLSLLAESADVCDEIQEVTEAKYDFSTVDTTLNTILLKTDTLPLLTGDKIRFKGANLPSPINIDSEYYVIAYRRQEIPTIKIATTSENAINGVAISLTTTGNSASIRQVVKIGEPRYHGGGVIDTSVEIGRNLQEIYSGMAGFVIPSGGKYAIYAGKYYQPVYNFNENDIVSNVSVTTKRGKQSRYNRVKGIYTSPINNGNAYDYPVVKNALYELEDGEVIERDLTLPFTQRPSTAQRIAKIQLERQRQEIIISASFNLKAFKVKVGDNIYFSFEKYGWNNKVFEVIEWSLNIDDNDGVAIPVINMILQENASGVYDWNFGEETTVDLAKNTSLPNPFYVEAVTGLALDSMLVSTQNNDKTYKIVASWDIHPNAFVRQGGFFELEFKRTNENYYKSVGKVDGDISEVEIPQLQPNVTYDIRIRAFNKLRVSSGYTSLYNFIVGQSLVSNNEDWENETETRDGTDWEINNLPSEDWE